MGKEVWLAGRSVGSWEGEEEKEQDAGKEKGERGAGGCVNSLRRRGLSARQGPFPRRVITRLNWRRLAPAMLTLTTPVREKRGRERDRQTDR